MKTREWVRINDELISERMQTAVDALRERLDGLRARANGEPHVLTEGGVRMFVGANPKRKKP